MESISFITTEREHLFHLTRTLVDGISLAFMRNAARPVVMSVRGTYGDGKKIIPDAAVEKLFGIPDAQIKGDYAERKKGQPLFTGKTNYDEYWTGEYKGETIQVAFCNAAWKHFYSKSSLSDFWRFAGIEFGSNENRMFKIAKNFLKQRDHGGISFVHNSFRIAQERSWVNIWLERSGSDRISSDLGNHRNKSYDAPVLLREIFQAESRRSDWARFVTIETKHPALLADPQFQQAWALLKAREPLFRAVSG